MNKVPPVKGIMFFPELEENNSSTTAIEQIETRLLNRIRLGDAGSVRQLVSLFCQSLSDYYQNDMDKIKNAVFEFLVNMRNSILELDENYSNPAFEAAFSFLSKMTYLQEIEQFVLKRSMECVTLACGVRKNNGNPIIAQACEYLEKNIAKDITLESTASILNVSSFYLSKLFKKEKGENFISYLTNLRLKMAKELLKDKTKIIKEITAAVGYNDQNYFSKLFKQKFGITPTEFRESFFQENKHEYP